MRFALLCLSAVLATQLRWLPDVATDKTELMSIDINFERIGTSSYVTEVCHFPEIKLTVQLSWQPELERTSSALLEAHLLAGELSLVDPDWAAKVLKGIGEYQPNLLTSLAADVANCLLSKPSIEQASKGSIIARGFQRLNEFIKRLGIFETADLNCKLYQAVESLILPDWKMHGTKGEEKRTEIFWGDFPYLLNYYYDFIGIKSSTVPKSLSNAEWDLRIPNYSLWDNRRRLPLCPQETHFEQLPTELFLKIIGQLQYRAFKCRQVCRKWNQLFPSIVLDAGGASKFNNKSHFILPTYVTHLLKISPRSSGLLTGAKHC